MKTNKINYYLGRFKLVLFVVALTFSLVGSIQIYAGRYENIFKYITVVLYSTFKLFTFSPTNSITNEAPIIYELAIWIAPAFTMVGFFSVFKKIYQSFKSFVFHIGKDHLVLLGDNEETITFIKNLNQSDSDLGTILLCDFSDNVNEDIYKDLYTKIVKVDFTHPESDVNKLTIKDEKILDYNKLVSFEKEPKNYSRLNSLAIMTEEIGDLDIFVRTSSDRMKELIEIKMDKIKHFDINYFDPNELIIKNLFENSEFSPNPPLEFSRDFSKYNFKNIDEISNNIGVYNILIVGFSEISEKFLIQSSNYLTINPNQKMKVTIFDKNIKSKFENFKDHRKMLDRVMDVDLEEITSSSGLVNSINEKHENLPFSLGLFASDETRENIFNLDKLSDTSVDVPVALYSKELGEIDTVIDSLRLKHPKITAFGDLKTVLDKNIIIHEKLLERSIKFNSLYNKTAAKLMGWDYDESKERDAWKNLSTIKKESSIYQSAHRDTKLLVLNKLLKSNNMNVQEALKYWNDKLQNKSIEDQLLIVENDPILNFMTALEHTRWNNFYYMRDFEFGEKDEIRKTHDCLIDDWDVFMSSIQRDKAIYDTLSVLSLSENKR